MDGQRSAELAQRERTERERVIQQLVRQNRELQSANDQLFVEINWYRQLLGQSPRVRRSL